ncbi:MAG TPA: thioredoxin fold domain-containing protein [Thermotogota bacterium]|nr:thioredoxin fold domain-containing protein [Thermotogota bacterium]HRW33789.1 thioredoxin fold domain-containing protein [Thermotogota bacterium]
MKKLLTVTLLLMAFFLTGLAVTYEEFVFFNDFDTGFEVARILNKNVLLIFTSNSCPYCTKLKDEVLASEDVMNFLINNYILIEIRADNDLIAHFDVENAKFDESGKEYTYQDLFSLFGVRGVPATFFFNRELEFLGGFPGYLPANDYIKWLKYVETESYKSVEINDFEIEEHYNGHLLVKTITEIDLAKLQHHLPGLLTYYNFDVFKETNLIGSNPFQYYIIRQSLLKDVKDYLEKLDKKMVYNVYVLE